MSGMSSTASIIAAGAFFMLSNLAMKLLGDKPLYILYPAVATAILIGCQFQVMAFRGAQFGLVVVVVLGLEMLLSMLVARLFLGETYSLTNMAGVSLVILGMALTHLPASVASHGDFLREAEVKKGPRKIMTASADPNAPI